MDLTITASVLPAVEAEFQMTVQRTEGHEAYCLPSGAKKQVFLRWDVIHTSFIKRFDF